jgi:diaminopimelate epimerase
VSNQVPYVRASGCGNIFLLVERTDQPAAAISDITRRMCKELEADGVEWITPSPDADAHVNATLVNADGSQAELSGNGTRCVAAYWVTKTGANMVRVRTGAGVKECSMTARDGDDFEFQMNMGEPKLEGVLDMTLPVGKCKGMKLSMGNPQYVVFVENFEFEWQKVGAWIQAKRVFAEHGGVNVVFVRVLRSSDVEARFFERGVGATLSSGTGSCAAAVAAIALDMVVSPVRVRAEGGPQVVTWESGSVVVLRGPASVQEAGAFTL